MTNSEHENDWGPLAQPLHDDIPLDTRPWRDNAFLCFWDPDRDAAGMMHVSASPNAAVGRRARVSVRVGSRFVEVVEPLGHNTFDSESITFHPATGFTVDSPLLKGTINSSPLHALGVFAGADAPTAFNLDDDHPVSHYQRSATVTGSLTIDGLSVDVDGFGYRDRTWGFRDESATVGEYYGTMWVFPNFSVSAMRLLGQDGREVSMGFVLGADGSVTKVTGMTMVRDGAGHFVESAITTADGATLAVESTRRLGEFWCPMGSDGQAGPTLSAYDQIDCLRTSDGTEGHGMLEQGITRRLH